MFRLSSLMILSIAMNMVLRIIIRNTIAMLQQLGVHIVIEGVETEEQKSFLLGCGCTDAQGFLFHRPMPVEAFDALLLQQECEYDRTK